MMRRREFIMLVGAAAAWPFVAQGQEPYRLGALFFDELRRLGFTKAKTL